MIALQVPLNQDATPDTGQQHMIFEALNIIPIKILILGKYHTYHALINTGSSITSIKHNLIPSTLRTKMPKRNFVFGNGEDVVLTHCFTSICLLGELSVTIKLLCMPVDQNYDIIVGQYFMDKV